jgi:hypothetical protein
LVLVLRYARKSAERSTKNQQLKTNNQRSRSTDHRPQKKSRASLRGPWSLLVDVRWCQ